MRIPLPRRLRLALRCLLRSDPVSRLALIEQLSLDLGRHNGTPTDQERRFDWFTRIGKGVLQEYRYTWPQMGWWDDAAFNAYLDRFGQRGSHDTHRRWMVYQLLRLTVTVAGDTVECGAFQGAGSYLMAAANAQLGQGQLHHVFDSFAGLSQPSQRDGHYWHAGNLSSPMDVLRHNLSAFGDAVRLYPGWIPTRFAEVADRTFRFVHIDVDLHEPTRDSMAFFYPRVPAGGIIVCDDYLCTTCPGATAAVDEFLADKPEKMIALCAGGGFLVKGTATGPAQLPPS